MSRRLEMAAQGRVDGNGEQRPRGGQDLNEVVGDDHAIRGRRWTRTQEPAKPGHGRSLAAIHPHGASARSRCSPSWAERWRRLVCGRAAAYSGQGRTLVNVPREDFARIAHRPGFVVGTLGRWLGECTEDEARALVSDGGGNDIPQAVLDSIRAMEATGQEALVEQAHALRRQFVTVNTLKPRTTCAALLLLRAKDRVRGLSDPYPSSSDSRRPVDSSLGPAPPRRHLCEWTMRGQPQPPKGIAYRWNTRPRRGREPLLPACAPIVRKYREGV